MGQPEIDLTTAERHFDQVHYALTEWASRVTTPERTYVSAGHEAIAAIDDAVRELYAVRTKLVGEIRQDEDERFARVDAMLAESRARSAARAAAVIGECDERGLKPTVETAHEGFALGGRVKP